MKRFLYLIILLVCATANLPSAYGQQPPFYNEIRDFKKTDSANFPPNNAILFIGSSSFRMWKDVQKSFPNHTIINRGFGGSSLTDVIYYFNEVVAPYHPKQIVIYCGENDLTVSSVTPEMVLDRFRQLFTMIRQQYRKVPVVFVSIKPSPSRQQLMPQMMQSNQLIKNYLSKQRKTKYVDVYNKMLLADGSPDPTLFSGDRLHMNAKGYAIWQKALTPHLK